MQDVFAGPRRRGGEESIFAIRPLSDRLGNLIEKIAISLLLREIHRVEEAEDHNGYERERDDAGDLGRAGERDQRRYQREAPCFARRALGRKAVDDGLEHVYMRRYSRIVSWPHTRPRLFCHDILSRFDK